MDKIDQLTPSDIKSFRTTIATTLLKPGTILWRFSSSLHASKFGAYWIDSKTISEIMKSFSLFDKCVIDNRLINPYDLNFKKRIIRENLALLSDWDTHCEYRVKIQLKKEVIAHIGQIGTQQRYEHEKITSVKSKDNSRFKLTDTNVHNVEKLIEQQIGGCTQYVIPRFRDRKLNQVENEYARLLHFCHI